VVLRRVGELPRYEVEGTGPDHARHYRARLFVAGRDLGVGEGRSKKDAEQAAARQAWGRLDQRVPEPGRAHTRVAPPPEERVPEGA
jgi:ribonuclease III